MSAFDGLSAEQIIESYIKAGDDASADEALSVLADNHSASRIKSYFQRRVSTSAEISTYGLTRNDAEDLASRASVDLMIALRKRRQLPLGDGIDNFAAYVNAICYAVYSDFWRKRFAEYSKLKHRVRYLLLRTSSTFVARRVEKKKIVCKLNDAPDHRSMFSPGEIAEKVSESLAGYPLESEFVLVTESLVQARGWLYINELVEIVATLRGIREIPPTEFAASDEYLGGIADETRSTGSSEGNLFELTFLWAEIRDMPRFQRLALLYNLRDEDGKELNCVWFESGVASLAEIARAFEVDEAEMAALLVRLPLSDREIADALGIEDIVLDERILKKEAKVGNLRKVAREYLHRRIQGKQKRGR